MNLLSKFLLVGGVSEADATQTSTASAFATIGLKNGTLYFASAGSGGPTSSGGRVSGIALGTGELDLTGIKPGDVNVSINLDDDVWNAGYRFPGDVYQAVAIAYYPANATTAPAPQFGQQNWPGEFGAPSLSDGGKKLIFVDKDDNNDAYEYSIAVNKPGGGTVVLDPKIKNGGQR